jgi:hypothetical protein
MDRLPQKYRLVKTVSHAGKNKLTALPPTTFPEKKSADEATP